MSSVIESQIMYKHSYDRFCGHIVEVKNTLGRILRDIKDVENAMIETSGIHFSETEMDKKKQIYHEVFESAHDEYQQLCGDLIEAKKDHDKIKFNLLGSGDVHLPVHIKELADTANSFFVRCMTDVNEGLAYVDVHVSKY